MAVLVGGFWWGLTACKAVQELPFFVDPSPTATLTPTLTATTTPTPAPSPTPTPLPAARIEAGENALFLGDWEGARTTFTLALQNQPEPEIEAAAFLGLVRAQYALGETSNALNTLRQLVGRYPDYAAAYYFLGRVYSDLQRYGEAAEAFNRYLELRPGIIDSYLLEWAGDAWTNGGNYPRAITAYEAAIAAPRTGAVEPLWIKLGQAHSSSGDFQTALGVYDTLFATTNNNFYKSQLQLLRGEIYVHLGQPEVGYDLYREAAANYPFAIYSYLGMIRLVEAGVPVNEFDRGLVDYYAGEYSLAVAAFDRYLIDESIEHDGAAHYYKGLSLREFNAYEQALAEWEKLITTHPVEDPYWASAWQEKGYTQWAFLGDYAGAIQTFLEFVNRVPAHPRAAEFLFFAGQVAERDGQLAQAARYWERLTEEYPTDPLGTRASFLTGITYYRMREYSSALPAFQRALNRATAPEDKAAAALWIGKSRAALRLPDEARMAWQEAASYDPTGYYSERALELLAGRAPFTPPAVVDFSIDWARNRREAEAWITSIFSLPEGTDLTGPGALATEPRFVRGMELWHLGLYEMARIEFENLRLTILDDPVRNYQLANVLLDLGVYRTAIFCARQVLNLAGMDDAMTLGAPVWFNHVRFGLYYSELVQTQAQQHGLHPLLVWSLIRQESLFEGFVRSTAGARGLMQIIPSTGQGIYNNLGWPEGYTSEDLYRPVINIPFGVDYLADQLAYLNGDIYAALAGYNGGPGNARVWQALAEGAVAGGDPDLFLEIIRFEETRNYVRGVFEIFAIYRRIYDRTP